MSRHESRSRARRRSNGAPLHARLRRIGRVTGGWSALIALLAGGGVLTVAYGPGAAVGADGVSDTLLVTPTTQGTVGLPATGVTLDIAYATVNAPTQVTVMRTGETLTVRAVDTGGTPLSRFEMPLILHAESGAFLVAWPGPVSGPAADRWLVVFDAHGIYAVPADAPAPDAVIYVGPLEHYTPNLLRHDLTWGSVTIEAAPPHDRALIRREDGRETRLPTAARAVRYRDRFVPEDLGNPGGFMLLGWTDPPGLVDLACALRATLPADPDLPAPGMFDAPLALLLPFDCVHDWTVSWGYHHSTPQNRFAVDFAPLARGEHAVYAAHAGTLFLKRYGTVQHMLDIGLAARVLTADGVTSTVYGHLDPVGTLDRWAIDAGDLPDFAWVEVGAVEAGEMLGVMGSSGYATGPHIHVVVWSWDQSLYQPVPFGPLTEFRRGLRLPADQRDACAQYHR